MKAADKMLPAKPRWVSAGHSPLKAMIGSSMKEGNGPQTNPIAARCGSRLNSTHHASATRDCASPMMAP